MSENLNWDLPDDTFDLCYKNDDSQCASKGRLYSASQAFKMTAGHVCDTSFWPGSGAEKCVIDTVGICPVGWHVPSKADWLALAAIKVSGASPTYQSGIWYRANSALVDPFGLNIVSATICNRQPGLLSCHDSTLGTRYYSTTYYASQAVFGPFWRDGSGYMDPAATVWFYDPKLSPAAASYSPVRCIKN